MANFRTHVTVAALVSGALAASLYGVGRVAPEEVWALAALGAAGGVLPDLDSDRSRPRRFLFTALGVQLGFLALFALGAQRSLLEMLALLLGVFLLVRYGLHSLFARCTSHRGIFHSLAAAAFFGLLTTGIAHRFFGREALQAWLCGAFLALGYGIHLALDELYAVDISDRTLRRKRSLGSALKPFDLGSWRVSAAMVCALVAAFLAAPRADPFLEVYGRGDLYRDLYRRLLPSEGAAKPPRPLAVRHQPAPRGRP